MRNKPIFVLEKLSVLGLSNEDFDDDIVDNDVELDTDYHNVNLKEENIDIHHTPLDQEESILSI